MSMMKGIPKEVPKEARQSKFGCACCLWGGIECKQGSMYKPEENSKLCAAYTYYD